MIDQSIYEALVHFKPVFENFSYKVGSDEFPRLDELTNDDERLIEKLYRQWRNERVDIWCDECLNEAFNRLMNEVVQYEKDMQNYLTIGTDELTK